MKVVNIHSRQLDVTPEAAGALIDTLSSRHDALFPRHLWPPLKLDGPLMVGAMGGHGPIRYFVRDYVPGQSIHFQFTGPGGFAGVHYFEVFSKDHHTIMRHTIDMRIHGRALITWPLLFRPMHDALIEDAFTTAEASLGCPLTIQRWSLWVRLLRRMFSGSKARPQNFKTQ